MAHNVILGTAGHVDHGKSSLVKALTGIDPDRLKEEKARGITIDLGFADLSFGSDLVIGIVDVPGHERLVRNMLAGAGGIDLVAMVIAADEGVMPQSREHLAICDLLGIGRGLIVLTKTDLVEPDWVDLVSDDIRSFVKGTFLEDADIVPVSSRTGENIEILKEKIRELALTVPAKSEKGIFRLPIDRVFTLKGFGTVVTGTAVSGRISVDDPVEILPSGHRSKVRGLQSHGRSTSTAAAGRRVAVNLQGIEKTALARGDVLTVPDKLIPTTAMDCRLRLMPGAPPVKSKSQVHLHVGTSETIARVILYDAEVIKPGEEKFGQLRLQDPVVAMAGDRFVIRRLSPVDTIGGGVVLDGSPRRRKRSEGLADLDIFLSGDLKASLEIKIRREGIQGMTLPRLEGWTRGDLPDIRRAAAELTASGAVLSLEDHLVHKEAAAEAKQKILATLKEFHKKNPMQTGMPKEELRAIFPGLSLRLFGGLLQAIREVVVDQDRVRSAGFKVALSVAEEAGKARVLAQLREGGFQPPFVKEMSQALSIPERTVSDILKLLVRENAARRINESVYLAAERYDEMISLLRRFYSRKPEMTVAEFRDLIQATRKHSLPYLEHLDAARITLRMGDVRKFLLQPDQAQPSE